MSELTMSEITMTGRRPVKIDKADWDLVAMSNWHDGQYDFQANHVRCIVVRQHADGRRLVYGHHDSGPGGTNIGFRPKHAGFLIEPSSHGTNNPDDERTIEAIREVAQIIGDERLGEECIGDLPAEQL